MVVGTGAAFSDQDQIKNKEAVDVCTTLNIIAGMEDGSYRPANNVTRAQMCKMICVALNGGKEPTLGTNATPTFSDVRTDPSSSWAESFIESCNSQGIVSGVGGGRFSPSGSVTGTQAARMLLVALGYRADQEGFTGDSWAINVNTLASAKGLYSGIESIDANAALSRDNAAQMIWNALNAYEVEYVSQLVTVDGNLTSKLVAQDKVVGNTKDKITMLEDKYEADTAIGTFSANSKTDSTLKDGNIEIEDATINGVRLESGTRFEFKSDLDLKYLGEEIKVLYRDSKDGVSGRLDDKDIIYGIYVTGATTVYNITKGDLQDTAAGITDKIKFNDKEYKVADAPASTDSAAVAIDINYGNAIKTVRADYTSSSDNAAGRYSSFKAAFDTLKVKSADTIKFIVEDGKIVKAYVVETKFAKIASINATKLSLSGGSISATGLTIEDNDVYSGAAKDDIVAVQKLYDSNYYVIEKANIVSSDVTAAKSGTEVRINGNYSKLCDGAATVGDYDLISIDTTNGLGETYEFIMHGDYWVAAQQTSESTKEYAVVDAIDAGYGNSVNQSVRLIKADGTKLTAVIDDDTPAGIAKGDLVKYSTNNDGSVEMTRATTVADGNALVAAAAKDRLNVITNQAVTYNKNTKQIQIDGKTLSTKADCVVFVEYEAGKFMVEKSDNMNTFTAAAGAAVNVFVSLDKDGKVVAYKVTTSGKPSTNVSDSVYGYITARGTEKIDGDTYDMLTVWTATGEVTLKTEKLANTIVAGHFIEFKAGTDVTNAADITDITSDASKLVKIKVDSYDENRDLLTAVGGTQYPVDEDVALITIDYSETEGVEDQFTTIPTYDSEADKQNVAVVLDTVDGVADVVVAVFIDSDSNIE